MVPQHEDRRFLAFSGTFAVVLLAYRLQSRQR